MSSLADSVLVLMVLTNLAMLATSSLANSIRLLGLQGAALGSLVLLLKADALLPALLLAVGVGALKGLVYPRVLMRVLRKVKVENEDDPLVGYTQTFIAGILALAVAFIVAPALLSTGAPPTPALALPVALSTMISGLMLTVARRKALSQVLGYVVLENGIFLFALGVMGGLPLLLELGALLEVFFAVFVMGIAVDRISREFSTTNVDALDQLRG